MITPFNRFWYWHQLRVWLCEHGVDYCPSCRALAREIRELTDANLQRSVRRGA